jgi:DNA-binding XRE family transcriptional regulator
MIITDRAAPSGHRLPRCRPPAAVPSIWVAYQDIGRPSRPVAFGAVLLRHRRWLPNPDLEVLAHMAGITGRALAAIERGDSCELSAAFRVADALGQELAELVYEAERLTASGQMLVTRPVPCEATTTAAAYIRPLAFGLVVATHRNGQGMSQKELGRRARLSRPRVEAIEQGEMPSLASTFALADALQLSTTELLHQVRQYANHPLPRLVGRGPEDTAAEEPSYG